MDKKDSQEGSLKPPSDALKSLINDANSLILRDESIVDLSMRLKAEDVDVSAVIDTSLDMKEIDAAFSLTVAGLICGFSPSLLQVERMLPFVENILYIPFLVGHCSGDRITMLLDAVESEHMSYEREALCILLAVMILDGNPPPPRLLLNIKKLARKNLDTVAGMLLGHAAAIAGDEQIKSIAQNWINISSPGMFRNHFDSIRRTMDMAPEKVFSLRELSTPDNDITFRRSVEKVGRNEPCPCGSGKKYKKCCIEHDRHRLSDPSPVRGVTMADYRSHIHRYLSEDELCNLPVRELIRLDYHEFSTLQLVMVIRKMSEHRLWNEAESMMDELASRQDLPDGEMIDNYRHDFIYDILDAGDFDVAVRQIEKLEDKPNMDDELKIHLKLIKPEVKTLAYLNAMALDGLRNPDKGILIELACALLLHLPALGIVYARGCLTPRRELDSITVLDCIEEARDKLELPPGDDGQMLFDLMLDEAMKRNTSDVDGAPSERIDAKGINELENLRERLKEAQVHSQKFETQIRDLEKKLRESENTLSSLKRHEPEMKAAQSVKEEVERLRGKVRELKGIVKESHEERSSLRKELSEKNLQMWKKQEDMAHLHSNSAQKEPDEEETAPLSIEHGSSYIPVFSRRASEEIRSASGRAGREALQLVGRLAGIDMLSWSRVKQLQRLPDMYSARVDRNHRLLFRIYTPTGTMNIEALVPRKDLETSLKNIS